jgi:hypothetical protein
MRSVKIVIEKHSDGCASVYRAWWGATPMKSLWPMRGRPLSSINRLSAVKS